MTVPTEKEAKPSKVRTKTGEQPTPIELNPALNESKTVVFSWARMNPPTQGHDRLIETMLDIEADRHAVYLSHSENNKRNPLSYSDKLEYAQIAFGDVIVESEARNIVTALHELRESYENLILVVGEDRVEEFTEMFEKYNDRDFQFESWEIVSAGPRVGTTGVSGISATSLREACVADDFDRVLECLPDGLLPYAEEIQAKVNAVFNIDESISVVQRMKRGQQMKRHKEVLKVARKRALARRATKKTIDKRSKKEAIATMKQKLAGGQKLDDLSAADKSRLEDILSKRKEGVKRLAAKLVNKVRDRESKRLAKKK